jgi:hypothetical protein
VHTEVSNSTTDSAAPIELHNKILHSTSHAVLKNSTDTKVNDSLPRIFVDKVPDNIAKFTETKDSLVSNPKIVYTVKNIKQFSNPKGRTNLIS